MKTAWAARFVVLLFLAGLTADLTLTSCASRGNPSGGPRDTLAPRVDTTFPPNFSTHFNSNKVEVIFGEYITLKSASQQIRITPPLSEKLDIKAGLKSLEIKFSADSLLENTTYTITFGTAITDFTEGNVNGKFNYVFSTGDYIDSLSVKGSITNTEGKAAEGLLIALYDYSTVKAKDSLPFKALPTYYAYSDEAGNFSMQNLKYGKFGVVAFEDKGGKFKLLTNNQTTAFLNDTLTLDTLTKPISLKAFIPDGTPRFVNARHVAANKIRLAFNGLAKGTKVSRLESTENKKEIEDYLEFAKSDTLFYWFQNGQDSLTLLVENKGFYSDSTTVILREFPPKKIRYSLPNKEVLPKGNLYLKVNTPLLTVNNNGFSILTDKDTLFNLKPTISDTNKRILVFENPPKAKKTELLILKGAVTPYTGEEQDSVFLSYTSLTKEDVGTAIFTVVADSAHQYVLQVLNTNGVLVASSIFTGKTKLNLKNLYPEKYSAKLIVDEDTNGRWSSGNYLEGKQPERIIIYNEALEIRANWDLEVEWKVTQLTKKENDSAEETKKEDIPKAPQSKRLNESLSPRKPNR